MAPVVTVGIPTRNRWELCEAAIRSVLSQQGNIPCEIIVVDDASVDPEPTPFITGLIISKTVRLVRHQQCLGEAAARNTVIEHMQGEFAFWLDDDDCLTDNALASQLSCLQQNPQADVVYGNLLGTDETLNVKRELRYRDIPAGLLFYVLLHYSPFPNGGSLFRKTLFERVGGYDPAYRVGTDYNFWARAAVSGATFKHNDDFFYLYRSHPGNLALGTENDEFCRSNARVVAFLAQSVPLNRLFPIFDWQQNPEGAKAQALAALAIICLRYKQFNEARALAEQSLQLASTASALFVRARLEHQDGNITSAMTALEQALLDTDQELARNIQMSGLSPLGLVP